MATERLAMHQVREILRQKFRQIVQCSTHALPRNRTPLDRLLISHQAHVFYSTPTAFRGGCARIIQCSPIPLYN